MKERRIPEELTVFDCLCRPDHKSFVQDRNDGALVRIVLRSFELVAILLYAVCCSVGILTLYNLQRVNRFFRHGEYRLRRAVAQKQMRLKRIARHRIRGFFQPARQFIVFIRYVRTTGRSESFPPSKVILLAGKKLLHGLWRFLMGVLNIAAPIAAIWLLFATVRHFSQIEYGLRVEHNGVPVANVKNEAQYDEAQRRVAERMTGVDTLDPIGVTFTLTQMSKMEWTDTDFLINRLITLSSSNLFEGVGLYVDGAFKGALSSGTALLDSLAARMDAAKTGASGETVQFSRRIVLRKGLFPETSKTAEEELEILFNSQLSAEKMYTVQEGDTPIRIAYKNGISTDELVRLNPTCTTSLLVGDQLLIAQSVPYLRMKTQRVETSMESIAFSTERETDNEKPLSFLEVETEGENGRREITANVTYLDGEEVDRQVTRVRDLKQPVNRRIIVGGKKPEAGTPNANVTIDIVDNLGGEAFMWPVDGGAITMPIWGYRGHTGNDITGISSGTPIRASASGTVIYSAYRGPYGRHIIIDHGNGVQTLYAHNSANYVAVGDKVVQGQKIGAVGQTGNAFGNHCHFEIRQNGAYVDARQYVGSRSAR